MVDGGMANYGPGVVAGADTNRLLEEFGFTAEQIAQARADKVVAGPLPRV